MASEDEILALRKMVNEEDDCDGWDDESLGQIIDAEDTLNQAASRIWYLKAGKLSEMVNVSESGSSRALGDLMKNAQGMGKLYAGLDVPIEEEASGPVIHRIRRTIA
jgi:hypothetical protein